MWCVGIKCRRLARSRAEVHVQRLAAFVEQVLEVNVTTSCARSTLSSYSTCPLARGVSALAMTGVCREPLTHAAFNASSFLTMRVTSSAVGTPCS